MTLAAAPAPFLHSQGWTYLGGGQPGYDTSGNANFAFTADLATGQPYFFYDNGADSYKPAVVTSVGGAAWSTLGAFNVAYDPHFLSMATNPSTSMPYLAFQDGAGLDATVLAWDGSTWTTVGTRGFNGAQVEYITLAFDNSSTPYVAFLDTGAYLKAKVMTYAQGSWTVVGAAGFSPGQVGITVLAISPVTTHPYVAFQDLNAGSKATVMAWDGSAWGVVGSAGFTDGVVDGPMCLSVSATTGRPYISFIDVGAQNGNYVRSTFMGFDGSSWFRMGNAGQFYYAASMSLHPTTGIPYVAAINVSLLIAVPVHAAGGGSWSLVNQSAYTEDSSQPSHS